MLKRVISGILVAIMGLFLTGCEGFTVEIGELIVPPKPTGEMEKITEALYLFAGEDIVLRYPKSGEYRSAILLYDVDGDGSDEALAFYSTTTGENTPLMHVNLIVKEDESWISVSDHFVERSGIETIEFADIGNDRNREIIITFEIPTASTNKLGVFGYTSGGLIRYLIEDHSIYTVCDIDGDVKGDLLVLAADAGEKSAIAKVYTVEGFSAINKYSAQLDGEVQSYYPPIISKLPDGRPVVLVDADKGTAGTITEVLYVENGELINPFVSKGRPINIATLRSSTARCEDFDGDGLTEIPSLIALPETRGGDTDETVYMTCWSALTSNGRLAPKGYALINYTDGYIIRLKDEWVNEIAVVKRLDVKERTIMHYDRNVEVADAAVFKTVLLTSEQWANRDDSYDGYVAVAQNQKYIIAAKVYEKNVWSVTAEQLKGMISFIEGQ